VSSSLSVLNLLMGLKIRASVQQEEGLRKVIISGRKRRQGGGRRRQISFFFFLGLLESWHIHVK